MHASLFIIKKYQGQRHMQSRFTSPLCTFYEICIIRKDKLRAVSHVMCPQLHIRIFIRPWLWIPLRPLSKISRLQITLMNNFLSFSAPENLFCMQKCTRLKTRKTPKPAIWSYHYRISDYIERTFWWRPLCSFPTLRPTPTEIAVTDMSLARLCIVGRQG